MPKFPVRRSQLISPFGVGALQVVRDGSSVITAGLDHWYEREDGDNDPRLLDLDEFKLQEWRLGQLLGTDYFMLPPDARNPRSGDEQVPNSRLTVPFLRFPQWHFCPRCKVMRPFPLTTQGKQKCAECAKKKTTSYMVQVPIVAICEHGHIQDFPWREWVHHSAKPRCNGQLSLIATGGASLAAQKVVCGGCHAERTLASVTSANTDGTTFLSKNLEDGDKEAIFLCKGLRPWLQDTSGELCEKHLRGSLRNASNLYYANVKSAIYIPRRTDSVPSALIEILELPAFKALVSLLTQLDSLSPSFLRQQQRELLQEYTDEQIKQALDMSMGSSSTFLPQRADPIVEDDETTFRRYEYEVLATPRNEEQLTTSEVPLKEYASLIGGYLDKVLLLPRLIETRVFAGFTRIYPENDMSTEQRRLQLRRHPVQPGSDWLPAYRVYGEGILLTLKEDILRKWESDPSVQQRVAPLALRYEKLQASRRLRDRLISPRLVLLHTLSHLLINQLTFECGYSTAALRERLYVSNHETEPMAGILIYTASGDAEGTLGGLVRMGRPKYLEPVFERTLEKANWCSADPVCMEIGAAGGQGPDSCNLAACHSCSLLPETACEEFNRFLDRALVVGDPSIGLRGYFSSGKSAEFEQWT